MFSALPGGALCGPGDTSTLPGWPCGAGPGQCDGGGGLTAEVCCLQQPSTSLRGPPRHGSGSCQMIGPHAINSSPMPTAKTTPCSSADQGGQGWRGQQRGKLSEKGREKRERSDVAGHLPLGWCEDKPRHEFGSKQGPRRAPLPFPGVLPLKEFAHRPPAGQEEPMRPTSPCSCSLLNQWHLAHFQRLLPLKKQSLRFPRG